MGPSQDNPFSSPFCIAPPYSYSEYKGQFPTDDSLANRAGLHSQQLLLSHLNLSIMKYTSYELVVLRNEADRPPHHACIPSCEQNGFDKTPKSLGKFTDRAAYDDFYSYFSCLRLKRRRGTRWTARYILAIDLLPCKNCYKPFLLQEVPGWKSQQF